MLPSRLRNGKRRASSTGGATAPAAASSSSSILEPAEVKPGGSKRVRGEPAVGVRNHPAAAVASKRGGRGASARGGLGINPNTKASKGRRKKKHTRGNVSTGLETGRDPRDSACLANVDTNSLSVIISFLEGWEAELLGGTCHRLRSLSTSQFVHTFRFRPMPSSSSSTTITATTATPIGAAASIAPALHSPRVGGATLSPGAARQAALARIPHFPRLHTLELDVMGEKSAATTRLTRKQLLSLSGKLPTVECLRLVSASWEWARGEEVTVHIAKAYLELAGSCPKLRHLTLPPQRFSPATLPLLSAHLSGVSRLLSLDLSICLLDLDDLGTALMGVKSSTDPFLTVTTLPLKSLTVRLYYRPDTEDDADSLMGTPLAEAFRVGRLSNLERLRLVPEEMCGSSGESLVAINDMVWVQTDALGPVFTAMKPTTGGTIGCPRLHHLEVGEFLSPLSFSGLLTFLTTCGPNLTTLRLSCLNGDDLLPHLRNLAQMAQDGRLANLTLLHLNDLSSSGIGERIRGGRLDSLRALMGAIRQGKLPLLEDLSLRNTGALSADMMDVVECCPCPLRHLRLSNESEAAIYNANTVDWAAMRALQKGASHGVLPHLQALNLYGNRLSAHGAKHLATALANGAAPDLRRLDVRSTNMDHEGFFLLLKILTKTTRTLRLEELALSTWNGGREEEKAGLQALMSFIQSPHLPFLRSLILLDDRSTTMISDPTCFVTALRQAQPKLHSITIQQEYSPLPWAGDVDQHNC